MRISTYQKVLALIVLSGVVCFANDQELYHIQTDTGGKWIHLEGSAMPISLPYRESTFKASVSSDKRTIVFLLYNPSGNYYGLLVAHRKSATDTWSVSYELHRDELDLRFGRSAWVEEVKSLDRFPKVDLKVAYFEYRLAPCRVIREEQTWDLSTGVPEKNIEIDISKLDLGTSDPWQEMTVEKYRKRMNDFESSDERILAEIDRITENQAGSPR